MPEMLNVIVTCTQRKSLAVPDALHVSNLKSKRLESRVQEWASKLDSYDGQRTCSRQLYAGDAWSIVKEMEAQHSSNVRWWVCSAGYGLVALDTILSPYAATFSPCEDDTMIVDGQGALGHQKRRWWRELAQWRPASYLGPRTIADLAKQHPMDPILIAASTVYLEALEQDILEARQQLHSTEHLSLLSAGFRPNGPLVESLLPCSARFQARVGGARQSLNVRLLRLILTHHADSKDKSSIEGFLAVELNGLPELPTYERKPMSDESLRAFILDALGDDPDARHTPVLRKLRDRGMGCEQKRFRKLFHMIKET